MSMVPCFVQYFIPQALWKFQYTYHFPFRDGETDQITMLMLHSLRARTLIASRGEFLPTPSKFLITAPDPSSNPALTPCPPKRSYAWRHTYSTSLYSATPSGCITSSAVLEYAPHPLEGITTTAILGRTTRDWPHQQTGPYVDHFRHTQTPQWGRHWKDLENALHTPIFPHAQGYRAWALLWPPPLPPLVKPLLGSSGNSQGCSGV